MIRILGDSQLSVFVVNLTVAVIIREQNPTQCHRNFVAPDFHSRAHVKNNFNLIFRLYVKLETFKDCSSSTACDFRSISYNAVKILYA
ncbi:hypothetical protein GURASL_17020 [Geotalea uraniireducens]|uniref:Secreted protein n=1 Tax=Geotalea uraniireducens TaxID=351604 RepID=A0ABM8EK78_9BACT|nr:hypothetical protein GURASL_17020 [Geotalea uraniireducens]